MPRLSLAALLLLSAAPVLAEDIAPRDEQHGVSDPEIIVTAPYARDRKLIATAVTVLQGDDLQRQMRSTIGETLARQPGVSASFFGPNASRPILRGLDSERVRVLTDGIGSFDVSNTSVDHAVAANPLLADRIEIMRGPAALLFGSGAIGGVVNMRDLRIAREVPDGPHVDASAGVASAARERNIAASLNVPLGAGFVAHVDGSFFESDDYRTGGFVFSQGLRAEAAEEGGEVADKAQARGRLDNTGARTWDVGGSIAWIGESGANFGVAVSHLTNRYGIPNGLELGHDNEEGIEPAGEGENGHGDITLDMRQTRVDVRGAVPLSGAFKELRVRGGWADYQHDEIAGNGEPGGGEIGTSFFNKSWEARVELVQANVNGWQGASGVQYFSRNFSAVGEEAYIPANETRQFGLFTLQEFDLGNLRLEGGARYEHANVKSAVVGRERTFDALSLSVGGSVALGGGFRLALSAARTERAPSAEELFANGAHAATRAFEIGNPDFRKERQLGAEAVLRGSGLAWRLELSAFVNKFDNFIFLNPNGLEADELPVFQYAQADASFWGVEVEGALKVAQLGGTRVDVTGLLDYTRATVLSGGGAVPRIPPLRMIGGLEANGGVVGGRVEIEHVTAQDRTASFETRTAAFSLINASLSWKPFGTDTPTTLMVQANNIFDVEARRHSSFLKNVAPLFGRDIRVSLRAAF